jgi:hypothetical protein
MIKMIVLAEIGDWVNHIEDNVNAHVEDIGFVEVGENGNIVGLHHLISKGEMVYIVNGGTEMWPVKECKVISTMTIKKENE